MSLLESESAGLLEGAEVCFATLTGTSNRAELATRAGELRPDVGARVWPADGAGRI